MRLGQRLAPTPGIAQRGRALGRASPRGLGVAGTRKINVLLIEKPHIAVLPAYPNI